LRQDIKEALKGDYEFTLDGDTWRKAHIEVGAVVMEGAGALIASGAIIQNKTTESGVIDIGGGTTDLYVQRNNIPISEFCKGKRVAVETAQTILMEAFEAKYSPRVLTALEARDIMHAFAAPGKKKNYPQISVYGKAVDVSELHSMTAEAVNQVAGDILSFVSSAWRQAGGAARFDPVLLIGGGFYYFFDAIKKRIPHLTAPEDPTHANAIGYATLAARQLLNRNQEAAKKAAAVKAVQQPEA
jgi:hypothetical protein